MGGEIEPLSWEFLLPRLAAVAALVAANAFFVCMEFAVVAARRPRLESMARSGNSVAKLVLHMMDYTDLYIAAAQLGVTMASLALGWIGDVTIAALVEPTLATLVGERFGTAAAHAVGTIISFSLITFLHLVLGEQVPKVFTIRNPEIVAIWFARPMEAFTIVFRPIIWVLDRSTVGILHLLGVKEPPGHHHAYSLEELKLLVIQSEEEGLIPEQETEILARVFEFSDRLVREAMIPRPEIVGVEEDATVEELLQVFKEHRNARFPVYHGDLDHITGIVSIKDVLALLAENPDARHKRLKELGIIKPAFAVPETRRIGDLFQEMRENHIQMAIVIDEYGGTAGLVTLEELAEEILGRVTDEWVKEEPDIRQININTYDVNAQLRVDEVNEELGISIPESDLYETVAGFILYELGHIPKEGEELLWDGLLFRVLSMRGPKIERVSITILSPEEVQEEREAQESEITARVAAEEAHIG